MKRKNNSKSLVEFKKNAEDDLKKIFGKNLKALRESMDWSQEVTASIAGVNRSYYAQIEAGHRNPSLVNISKILAAFQVDFNDLVSLNDIKKLIK